MTGYGFPLLPNELALQIAYDADDASLLSLILCNRSLYTLLTPVLHARAILSRGPQTAMQWAAAQGHISLIKFLIARGVHPDDGVSNQNSAALRAAVVQGRTDIVDLLASNGADLNRQNYCGQSTFYPVIHDAAANGDTSMIKLLASHGAQVASENVMGLYVGTPLHMAVLCSHDAAVHTLLELGVPVDTEDSNCEFPLDVAAMVASEDADTEEWWDLMVDIGKMLVIAGSPLRYSEESLRDLSERLSEERSVCFYRLMAEEQQKLALIESVVS